MEYMERLHGLAAKLFPTLFSSLGVIASDFPLFSFIVVLVKV
jgi:hypothetical protein